MQSLVPVLLLAFPCLLFIDVASVHLSSTLSTLAQKNQLNQTKVILGDKVDDVYPVVPTLPPPPTPSPSTTVAPSTTPVPYVPDRKFDTASFIGGFVLCAGLTAIGFVSWKFYKARVELTYRTL